jgi:hypothetical protein
MIGYSRKVLLDIDNPKLLPELLVKLPFVARKLELSVLTLSYCYSSSRRGFHVVIFFKELLSPMLTIILQVMLGSDWRRETFNLVRVRNLRRAPAFWQSRWNVLYGDKWRTGT